MATEEPRTEADDADSGGSRQGRTLTPAGHDSLTHWVLMSGNRWVVTGFVLLLVALGFVALGTVWTDEITSLFTETGVVETLLLTLLSGVILLVSIAVSVNAVVLSQEITALGEQEEQIEETFAFRDDIRERTDASESPARPAAFLQVILEAAREKAVELREGVRDADPVFRDRTMVLVDDVIEQVDDVLDRLEDGSFRTFDVLLAGIEYDYSWQVYATRRIRIEHDDELTDTQREAIDDLLQVLKYFTIGREYFKTLYLKSELAKLSRWLLVVAFPVIVLLSYAMLAIQAGLLPELSVFGIPSVVLFVGFAYALGLVPFTLFSVYVFRTATIAGRTLAAGPFILKPEDKRGRIDWESEDTADPQTPVG